MKYVVKIIVDSYKELEKLKSIVSIKVTEKTKSVKFIYEDLIFLFNYISINNVIYKKINIILKEE